MWLHWFMQILWQCKRIHSSVCSIMSGIAHQRLGGIHSVMLCRSGSDMDDRGSCGQRQIVSRVQWLGEGLPDSRGKGVLVDLRPDLQRRWPDDPLQPGPLLASFPPISRKYLKTATKALENVQYPQRNPKMLIANIEFHGWFSITRTHHFDIPAQLGHRNRETKKSNPFSNFETPVRNSWPNDGEICAFRNFKFYAVCSFA